jgi:hypothetical protein
MSSNLDAEKIAENYWMNRPEKLEANKIEDFANVFQ